MYLKAQTKFKFKLSIAIVALAAISVSCAPNNVSLSVEFQENVVAAGIDTQQVYSGSTVEVEPGEHIFFSYYGMVATEYRQTLKVTPSHSRVIFKDTNIILQ